MKYEIIKPFPQSQKHPWACKRLAKCMWKLNGFVCCDWGNAIAMNVAVIEASAIAMVSAISEKSWTANAGWDG